MEKVLEYKRNKIENVINITFIIFFIYNRFSNLIIKLYTAQNISSLVWGAFYIIVLSLLAITYLQQKYIKLSDDYIEIYQQPFFRWRRINYVDIDRIYFDDNQTKIVCNNMKEFAIDHKLLSIEDIDYLELAFENVFDNIEDDEDVN